MTDMTRKWGLADELAYLEEIGRTNDETRRIDPFDLLSNYVAALEKRAEPPELVAEKSRLLEKARRLMREAIS